MDIRYYYEKQKADDANRELVMIRKRLENIVIGLSDKQMPDYTGWFVLLKESNSPSGWDFVGFFNPELSEEKEEPEWDFAIPIKEKECIEEFTGW